MALETEETQPLQRASTSISSLRLRFSAETFVSFQVMDFRWLWASSLATTAAWQMLTVAQGWLVFDLTGSRFNLGLAIASISIPLGILPLIGGVVIDRVDKKKLLTACVLVNALSSLFIGYLVLVDSIQFWHLILAGVINGVALAFSMPGRMAMVREIVGADRITNAVALNSSAFNLMRILGPLATGFLLVYFTHAGVFFVTAALNLAGLFFLLPVHTKIRSGSRKRMMADLVDGLSYVKARPVLVLLLSTTFMASLFGMAYIMLMPAFAKDALNVDADGLGLLLAFGGIGAILGSLAVASLGHYRQKGRLLTTFMLLWALLILIFTATGSLPDSAALGTAFLLLVFMGFFGSTFLSLNNALLQVNTDMAMQGRVMSLFSISHGFAPVGILPISWLADSIGTAEALAFGALVFLAFGLLVALSSPRLRQLT